jgi:hypothetical protein
MTILTGMAGLKGPTVVESPDSWTALLTSGLAGAAAAAAVAIVLTLYFRERPLAPRHCAPFGRRHGRHRASGLRGL